MNAEFTFNPRGGRGGRRRLIGTTLVVLVLLLVDVVSSGGVRQVAQRAGTSIWNASAHVRGAIFSSGFFATRASLARENVSLKNERDALREKSASYEAVRQENDILRSLVHLAQNEKGITAPIVSSVRSSPYGTFLLGAGERDDIAVGSLVITEGGFVVGRVSHVGDRTTTVTEIFAGGQEIDAQIQGAVAPAEGRGGGNARVDIPRGVALEAGDVVTAPQLGGRPIGIVGKVESESSSASQTAYVHLPVNLGALRYVYIVPQQ